MTTADRQRLRALACEYAMSSTGEDQEIGSGLLEALDRIAALEAESAARLVTIQRESAWVNERNGVIAFLTGAIDRISKSETAAEVRACAEMAQQSIAEWHAGLWKPGPHDDAADWKAGSHEI